MEVLNIAIFLAIRSTLNGYILYFRVFYAEGFVLS